MSWPKLNIFGRRKGKGVADLLDRLNNIKKSYEEGCDVGEYRSSCGHEIAEIAREIRRRREEKAMTKDESLEIINKTKRVKHWLYLFCTTKFIEAGEFQAANVLILSPALSNEKKDLLNKMGSAREERVREENTAVTNFFQREIKFLEALESRDEQIEYLDALKKEFSEMVDGGQLSVDEQETGLIKILLDSKADELTR